MRFFLDNDVPVRVGRMLRRNGHHCWTAADAGLAAESQDDNLSVYAYRHHAILVTLDREFTERRRRNPIGHHICLRCPEPDAADVLEAGLTEVLEYLQRENVTIIVSEQMVRSYSAWGRRD